MVDNKSEVQQKILEYKDIVEGNIIGCIWKTPDLLFQYTDLILQDFSYNKWRVFFQIIYDLTIVEKKATIDDMVVNLYLEKHPKLSKEYNKLGGYDTITTLANEFTKIENFHSYIDENIKWNCVTKLIKNGQQITIEDLKKFVDMNVEDIYSYFDSHLQNIFIKMSSKIQTFDLADNIDELVDEIKNGNLIGLEYFNMPMLTELTNGCPLGNITLLGSPTGTGKSTFLRNTHITSIIKNNERVVIFVNEEGLKKWQREFIAWVANNIYKTELEKASLRKGNLTSDGKLLIDKCVLWIKKMKERKLITIAPINTFKTSNIIMAIKKYSSLGIKYFAIDTFKTDGDAYGDNDWALLEKNMVSIYDTIKSSNRNVHIFITIQLKLSDVRQRYLTLDNTAKSKGVAEVVSCYLMIRKVQDDEYPDEKRALDVRKIDGKANILVKLDKTKKYMLVFIVKNREGECGDRQIVIETDMSKNIYKEVGYTYVPYN